jgi:hypothetical protein
MRLVVTVFVLAGVSCAAAQSQVAGATGQPPTPMIAPKQPVRGQRLGHAGMPTKMGAAKAAPNVPPNTPVVTVKGVCKDPLAKGPCETVITREDLDRYVNSFSPGMSEAARGRMAVQYARTLAFSKLAEQRSLDKNPLLAKEIDEEIKLVRMRMLSTAFLQTVQKPTPVADADIQKYYKEHLDQYEQVQVRRLAIPFAVPTATALPLDRAAVKSEMDNVRVRIIAGDDPNQVLQDAYKHLNIQASPPPVMVTALARNSVQGDEAKALDLKAGEVSEVLDSVAALCIIKVETRDTTPLGAARQEIESKIRRDLAQIRINEVTKQFTAQFNLEYLDMAVQPDVFGSTPLPPAMPVRGAQRPVPAPGQ